MASGSRQIENRIEDELRLRRASELLNDDVFLKTVYGDSLYTLLENVATGVGVHVTMLGPLIVATCAGVCGFRASVLVDPDTGWKEAFLSWTVVLAPSATGKTPCVGEIIRAVNYASRKLTAELNEHISASAPSPPSAQNTATDGGGGSQSRPFLISPATVKLNFVDNTAVTMEATHQQLFMMQNSTGIVVNLKLSDELGRVFNALGEYKGGKGTDRDYMIGWCVVHHYTQVTFIRQ